MWGKNASICDINEGDVIAIRGARLTDYEGRIFLNSDDSSSLVFINPDHEKCTELKSWFET